VIIFVLKDTDLHLTSAGKRTKLALDPDARGTSRLHLFHQTVLAIQDSLISSACSCQAHLLVEIGSSKEKSRGSLIHIQPSARLPRSFKRFSGLFAQVLSSGKVIAGDDDELVRCIQPSLNTIASRLTSASVPIVPLTCKPEFLDEVKKASDLVSALLSDFEQRPVPDPSGMPWKSDTQPVAVFVLSLGPQGLQNEEMNIEGIGSAVAVVPYEVPPFVVASRVCLALEPHLLSG